MATLTPPLKTHVAGSGAPTDSLFTYTNPTSSQPGGEAFDGLEYLDGVTGTFYRRVNGVWGYTRQINAPDPFTSPTGLLAESFPRLVPPGAVSDNNTPLTSGTLYAVGIVLRAGQVVNKVQFLAGATAEATGTHAWTALADAATFKVQAVSADNTGAAAVGASALFGAAFAASYTVPATGLYFAILNVTATTPPSLICAASLAALTGLTPKLVGTSTTGATTPITVGTSLTALTATAAVPYVQVS